MCDPSAESTAGEQSEALRCVVNAERQAFVSFGSRARDKPRERCFKNVEANEEKRHEEGDFPDRVNQIAEKDEKKPHDGDAPTQKIGDAGILFGPDQRLDHAGKADQNGGQINPPVVRDGQSHRDETRRNHHEDGHLHAVKEENPRIKTHELRVEDDLGPGLMNEVFADGLQSLGHVGHNLENDEDGRNRERGRNPEEPGDAPEMSKRRRRNQTECEGEADRSADKSHGFRNDALTHAVGDKSRDGGGDGTRTLDGSADHDYPDIVADGGNDAPECEEKKTENDDGFSPETVAGRTEGNLENTLCKAVNTESQADDEFIVAAFKVTGVNGKHGKNQKKPEHAQSKDAGERHTRTLFLRSHFPGIGGRGLNGLHEIFKAVWGTFVRGADLSGKKESTPLSETIDGKHA